MSPPRRTMHLAVELPGRGRPGPLPDFAAYARLAATAERGLFDFVLLTDIPAPPPEQPHDAEAPDTAGALDGGPYPYALPGGRPEPVTVLNALAAVTVQIGLAALPAPGRAAYDLARGIAALDRLSGGRAAGTAGVVAEFTLPVSPQGRPVTIRDGDQDGDREGGGDGSDTGGADGDGGADVVVGHAGWRARPGAKLLARLAFTLAEAAGAPALAERLDGPVQSGALDGYVLLPEPVPGGRGLDAFVDLVVPLLQKRGSLRASYRGTTLREHLGLARPLWKP
jgi:alkanesulfonate monooxygenase SsuD/methylene tetrahydromethanopterin reductase-like flavin-dependent oxidoreductase (luciferase family)